MTSTGRTLLRSRQPGVCIGCEQRIRYGDPITSAIWPRHLSLEQDQVNYLLQAAAEFRDLASEAGEPESVVAFVDWLSVDALRTGYTYVPLTDGREGNPDPIPFAPLPMSLKKAAGS